LSNNFLLFNGKIYVPLNCRSSVLNICHDSPSAGHFGFKKTFSLINRDFWWPSMQKDLKEYIKSCEICCRSKDSRHKPYGFLNPLEIPDRPWTSLSMDFITDLPSFNGFTCILVVLDRFTKMGHFIPFSNISFLKTLLMHSWLIFSDSMDYLMKLFPTEVHNLPPNSGLQFVKLSISLWNFLLHSTIKL